MILVTGGTGLVGRHLLVELMNQRESIRVLYRTEDKRKKTLGFLEKKVSADKQHLIQTLDWFKGDLLDIPLLEDAFKGIEIVYHCAGLVSFDIGDKQKLRKINIEGTANIVNLALAHKVKKLCHLSSVAALGNETNNNPITENSPRNPEHTYDYYEISKYGGEMEVWRATQEGLSVVIVNPGIIIGSGNWTTGSGQLFDRVAKGFPFKIPRRSGFVAVKDVVNAMIQLTRSDIENQRFILVGEVVSFEKITHQIALELHRKPPRIRLRKWMMYPLWLGQTLKYIFTGKGKQITLSSINDIFGDVDFDNSKIQKFLDFRFTPLEEAIRETAKDYLEELK